MDFTQRLRSAVSWKTGATKHVSTVHPNAAKSSMGCVCQRFAYPQYVPDCCIIRDRFTEHHLGFDYYYQWFNEDGDGKICL